MWAFRRARAGHDTRAYYWALAVVFVTATGMAGIRWEHDAYLFALGSAAFAVASVGYAARRIRWRGWTIFHIGGMSLSYIVLLTAFCVDKGPHLPLWNRLPTIALWIGPSIVGLPLAARALTRSIRALALQVAAHRTCAFELSWAPESSSKAAAPPKS